MEPGLGRSSGYRAGESEVLTQLFHQLPSGSEGGKSEDSPRGLSGFPKSRKT
jgi:hypothetical protein